MEPLRKSAVADPEFDFMLGECKPLIINVGTADDQIDAMVDDTPTSLRSPLLQRELTVEDIKNAPNVTASTTGSGIYAQWHEMPGKRRNLLRIGSIDNPGKRLYDHDWRRNNHEIRGGYSSASIYLPRAQPMLLLRHTLHSRQTIYQSSYDNSISCSGESPVAILCAEPVHPSDEMVLRCHDSTALEWTCYHRMGYTCRIRNTHNAFDG